MKDITGSITGNIVRELMADVTSTATIGKKIKNGEFRKNPIEPPWKCPDGYIHEELSMDKFSMELVSPKESGRKLILLQLHGGGYIGPIKNIYRTFAVLYSEALEGGKVLTIDYRVAPEDPFPAAIEDAYAAYKWILKQG